MTFLLSPCWHLRPPELRYHARLHFYDRERFGHFFRSTKGPNRASPIRTDAKPAVEGFIFSETLVRILRLQ